MPGLSIVIPALGKISLLEAGLVSVLAHRPADCEVIVVLNGKQVNEGRNAVPSDGSICLQSEGWPVQYRNVAVKELDQ